MIDTEEIESYESMKEEACSRMACLRLPPKVIEAFRNNSILKCSDGIAMVDVPENILNEIKDWENKYHNTVYHVIHCNGIYEPYTFETYECLCVSCYRDDWNYERNTVEANRGTWIMSHSINVTVPEYTESGSILIVNMHGILKRIG